MVVASLGPSESVHEAMSHQLQLHGEVAEAAFLE